MKYTIDLKGHGLSVNNKKRGFQRKRGKCWEYLKKRSKRRLKYIIKKNTIDRYI